MDALDGAPGVRSARYGGPGLDDACRVARLLSALASVPDARRPARFRCVIALARPGGEETVVEGTCEGVIARAPRGSGGFGDDPIFFYLPWGVTVGEVSDVHKATVSHRGLAAAAARTALLAMVQPHAWTTTSAGSVTALRPGP